jgi:hypothetical protein
MAFGFRYWMVYLRDFNRESFLLFVHNPAGQTKLRDYSGDSVRVVGQPSERAVISATTIGQTRFETAPHDTTDNYYWKKETLHHNSRYLSGAQSVLASVIANRRHATAQRAEHVVCGLAHRGSRRQLQEYVNEHEEDLTREIMKALPPRLTELGARIRWVSPLARDNYTEYRDGDFLTAVGLGEYVDELRMFWPTGGPSWDALGIVEDSQGKLRPGVVLVEAKSHVSEIYGAGCQAAGRSRDQIDRSLSLTKVWAKVSGDADWTGPLYQSANRLAHLYFIREQIKHPAWLVNLYFLNDPIDPTSHDTWNAELQKVKSSLGLTSGVPYTIDLLLPALSSAEHQPDGSSGATDSALESDSGVQEEMALPAFPDSSTTEPIVADQSTLSVWVQRWLALGRYEGPSVPDVPQRIEQAVQHWRKPIPGLWKRGLDLQLLGKRYRRGDIDSPRNGEHAIEHAILCRHFDSVSCFGQKLLDGINAFPLVRDAAELDMTMSRLIFFSCLAVMVLTIFSFAK